MAFPDGPCVTARERLGDGNVRLTILTAQASVWSLGFQVPVPITGAKLSLKAPSEPAKRGLSLQSKDPSITLGIGNNSLDDPVLQGATLRVRAPAGCNGPCDTTYTLPKEGWSYIGVTGAGLGYKYKDKLLALGPVKAGTIKPGKSKLAAKGIGLVQVLDENPAPVDVVLAIGEQTYCMTFGGQSAFVGSKVFVAKNAAVGSCP
jgi:hypothetical protein